MILYPSDQIHVSYRYVVSICSPWPHHLSCSHTNSLHTVMFASMRFISCQDLVYMMGLICSIKSSVADPTMLQCGLCGGQPMCESQLLILQ